MSLGLKIYLANARRAGARALQDQQAHGNTAQKRLARPAGQLIWLHASNAEETSPVQELIRALASERDDISFLVTTPENTPVDLRFQDSCEQPCIHLTAPPDTPQQVAEFLGHWNPTISVWAGSTLRPALLVETHDRNIPMVMVDARCRAQIEGRKRWKTGMIFALLALFDRILVGKPEVVLRLIRQGANPDKTEVCGLLEEGATTLYCDDKDRDEMAARLAARPIWLAMKTVDGEESITAAAHRAVSRLSHRLMLVISPMESTCGDALAESLTNDGWLVAQRSKGQDPDEHIQIFIADTPDELGLWLRLAPVCFIGNSLIKGGKGCSPFEASALGSAILHGPFVESYRTGYARLDIAGAAREVRDAADLATNLQELLAPDIAAAMAHAGWAKSTSGAEAVDHTVGLILETLAKAEDI
ncbi:3-deoxy-D-manno-octulosonic acid transferase [Profundibacter sp.]|uniref:3-deoxy-D-manno-octulosonic acid transferase n=1 Tax=Profundibacter sp. TaxID=3101071 RepID=UPI003D0E41A2